MPGPIAQTVGVDNHGAQLVDGTDPAPVLIVNGDPVAVVYVASKLGNLARPAHRAALSPGKGLMWPKGHPAFAGTDAGLAATVTVVVGGDGMTPTAAEIAEHIGAVTLTLGPGSQVIVEGAGSTLTQDAGTPNFSVRSVSASAAATGEIVSTSNNPAGTLTVVAGVVGVKYELHIVSLAVTTNTNTNGAIAYATLEDATTGDNVAEVSAMADANAGNTVRATATLDLQGVTLPAGHGIRLRLSNDGSGFVAGAKTIATLSTVTYLKVA